MTPMEQLKAMVAGKKVASRCSRGLFIVDGNIKGEYTELSNETDPNRRERDLNNWLMDQGW